MSENQINMSNVGGGGSAGRVPHLIGRLGKSPSYHEILPRLYLGDIVMAMNKDEIMRLGITDMITVEIKPIPAADLAPCIKRYLYINVMDHPKQDIMSHFDVSNEFINSSLEVPTNKVYVHCVAGISRSASLVIAYVMKSKSMSYTDAIYFVNQKRRVVDPNEGFVKQLFLYQRMNYTIDISNIEYRRIVLETLVFEFRLISLSYYQVQGSRGPSGGTMLNSATIPSSSSTSPSLFASSSSDRTSIVHVTPIPGHRNIANRNSVGILFDQFYNKLHLQEVSKYPQVYDSKSAFKCNKCRAIVFYAISVIENKPIGTQPDSEESRKEQKEICSFIFIEPQPWMSRNVLERDGVLMCYKCKRKLGKFDWTSGEDCSCALHHSHRNVNLFKIMRKKVDAS